MLNFKSTSHATLGEPLVCHKAPIWVEALNAASVECVGALQKNTRAHWLLCQAWSPHVGDSNLPWLHPFPQHLQEKEEDVSHTDEALMHFE